MSTTSSSNTISTQRDPSLKRYFKFMLQHRKMSVQFTQQKIKDIIQDDLGINFKDASDLYIKVSIDAFAYYMQSWPEWPNAINSEYSDKIYANLVNYLKSKLQALKQHEKDFLNMNKEKEEIAIPVNIMQTSNYTENSKVALQINVPESLWCTKQITFNSLNDDDLTLEFENVTPSKLKLEEIINHPYVYVEFKVPGLIHIQRSTPFKFERYLHNYDVVVPALNNNSILSIEQQTMTQKPKVYTHRLLADFFEHLKRILDTRYSTKISAEKRKEVESVSKNFLDDILESNLSNATTCEGYSIEHNMSQRSYFFNKIISFDKDNTLNGLIYKTILTPVVSYSLNFCTLLQHDIKTSQYPYFNFIADNDVTFETLFLGYINMSVKYKCLVCDLYYDLAEMRKHLIEMHPLEEELICTRCFKNFSTESLLRRRWSHECNIVSNLVL